MVRPLEERQQPESGDRGLLHSGTGAGPTPTWPRPRVMAGRPAAAQHLTTQLPLQPPLAELPLNCLPRCVSPVGQPCAGPGMCRGCPPQAVPPPSAANAEADEARQALTEARAKLAKLAEEAEVMRLGFAAALQLARDRAQAQVGTDS